MEQTETNTQQTTVRAVNNENNTQTQTNLLNTEIQKTLRMERH